MTRSSWIKYLWSAAFCLFLIGSNAQAETVTPENQTMQFSYTTNGAADGSMNAYGNNEVSVSGSTLTVQIGDSDGNWNISGVGIYEMKLTGENLEAAKQMAELLCSPKNPKSDVIVPILYAAKCGDGMKYGYISEFNRDAASKIADLVDLLINAGAQAGKKIVKLDISLVSITRDKSGFIVSLRFENGGDYPIQFKTPDKWETKMGKYMDILAVNDTKSGTGAKIGFALAGQPLADPTQFPGGEIKLAPHSAVVVRIKTTDIREFSAGTYELYAGAFMNISVAGMQSSLSRVDFHSDFKKPTRITFDRGYPSTPQEREQWEAMRRTEMSFWPVKPGETFAEDGLYRAMRTNASTHRSLQLVPFKAGTVATTGSVKMLMEGGDGISFDGPVQWLWEGSAPTPVKQHSFDMIEETRQFCEPGSPCPRSGRWLPRILEGWDAGYRYDVAGIVTVLRGQTMPPIPKAHEHADWEWLGA